MKGITNERLGKKIKALRNESHMEQELLAKILDIPRTAITAIEAGQRQITAMELVTICKLFKTPPNDLLDWHSYRSRTALPKPLESSEGER